MPISTHVTETRVRVRYAETDASGIAHHSAYVPWLEAGRVEWLRAIGMRYSELEAAGYSLPVIELHIRYVASTRFDDALVVRSALSDLRSRSLRFSYELVTDEARPRQVANGMSRHICLVDGRVGKLPPELRDRVQAADSPPARAAGADRTQTV